jgi:hypothetical protein
MNADYNLEAATEAIVQRARDRLARHRNQVLVATDRLFAKMLFGQWLFAIFIALTFSPYTWEGKVRSVNPHVWAAIALGAVIVSFPIALTLLRPGQTLTRHVVAVAQMLVSALLIHLSGGRIETHFHVFGSLAFLAFYLDWKVLLTAGVTIALDHFVRGLLWPESAYGIPNPEWWRFLEHGFWVVFCVSFLVASCRRQLREWLAFAEEGGMIEAMAEAERHQQAVVEHSHAVAKSS